MTTESTENENAEEPEAPEETPLKDRYVDPSSGAAPQPGSAAVATGDYYEDPDDVPLTVAPGFQGLDAQNDEEREVPEDSAAAMPEQGGGPVYPVEDHADNPVYDPEAAQEIFDADAEAQAEAQAEAEAEEGDDADDTEGDGDDSPSEGDDSGNGDGDGDGDGDDPPAEPVDYTELLDGNIPSVMEYVSEHPDEREAVLAAEQAGKNRPTLVSQLQG